MKPIIALAILLSAFQPQKLFAQEARMGLEVASVKVGNPVDAVFGINIPPGGNRFSVTNATLEMLIEFAYGLPNAQISGGSKWIDAESFTIEAKVDSATPLPPGNAAFGQVMLLLQSLLTDRFKLSVHIETRSEPVYELAVVKDGAKLKKADADDKPGRRIGRGLIGGTMPLALLAVSLSQSLDRPVFDKTGLAGNYSFTLTYTPQIGQGSRFGAPAPDSPQMDSAPHRFSRL